MYSYTPKKTNKIAEALALCLFLVAAVLLIFPAIVEIAYVGVVQTAGVVFAIAALAVLTRYTFKSFTYRIAEREDGGLDLTVTEWQGKRDYTVCRISLSNIEELAVLTEENRAALKKKQNGRKFFSYFVELSPKYQCWIFATECDEPLVIKLSPDDTLLDILKANAGKKSEE